MAENKSIKLSAKTESKAIEFISEFCDVSRETAKAVIEEVMVLINENPDAAEQLAKEHQNTQPTNQSLS